ncbi:GDYXXLXY domain-containing protein [Halosquirtibacter laminarini]|uniref:GDYXXLXY domain-containing protein n=1 Tax=Halosquirtibacter laminarini TaxID=3374600 RepID=A0AC61NQ49_9BACT|nr:GDYXXLXY domain-containing protein [Prolixibacteraceae bacterium]
MKHKIVLPLLFILMVIFQFAVPLKMVRDCEHTLTHGNVYKFKTKPIDPTDPFRGKYVALSFEADNISVNNEVKFESDEPLFVTIVTDEEGYAKISQVWREEPTQSNLDYFKVNVNYYGTSKDPNKLVLKFPFDRFYMSEHKAKRAENTYRNASRANKSDTYGVVRVEKGMAVIENVMINGVPITDLVK